MLVVEGVALELIPHLLVLVGLVVEARE